MSNLKISKKIWIINQYGSLPSTGIGGRHRHFARELSILGNKVHYISSRLTHNTIDKSKALTAPEIERFEGFVFIRINSIKYKHAHDKKRIINWFYFAYKLLNIKKKINEIPDVIIYSSPSLVGFISAYFLAKKYKAKIVFDVRDIWPLTLIKIGGFSKYNIFIKFLQILEDFAYKNSDYIISSLQGLQKHIHVRVKTKKKFTWIPNGFWFKESIHSIKVKKKILTSINSQEFSITYTGTIGEANSLDTLIEAMILIKKKNHIHLNIFGEGRLSSSLKSKVKKLNLRNVHFWGKIKKNQIQSVLKASDACVLCWKKSDLYKYGVAANKLYDYLSSGKPIIQSYSGSYDIIKNFKAGITVPAENNLSLSKAIANLYSMSTFNRIKMGERGKQAAHDYFEYSKISEKLNKLIYS
jgi:hypothetical protein